MRLKSPTLGSFSEFAQTWRASTPSASFALLSTLSVSGAPFSDDGRVQYHLSIVKDKLRMEQKSLHLGEARVAGLLTEILTSELADIKDVDNPLIAALAYAVAALVTWKYVEPVPEPDSGDYNPLTYGLGPGA
jgi:hypothetical protein